MFAAILHVAGALLAAFAFYLFTVWVASLEGEHLTKRRFQEGAMALGVTVEAIETDPSLIPKLAHFSSEKYSGELFKNRLSDLCGVLRTGWGWFGSLVQTVVPVWVLWMMYEEGADSAMAMWSVPALSVFFWVANVVFSYTCHLVTGRFPGEAKAARNYVASLLRARGEL